MLLTAFLVPPANRDAQAALSISTNYYFVAGTNSMALRAAMTQLRPWKHTSPYDAYTKWDTATKLTLRRGADQYFIASFHVNSKAVVTLPCWVKTPEADPELTAQWQDYFRGLSRHEQGHVQLARDATAKLERRLSAMAGYNSADELTAAARRVAGEVLAEYRKKSAAYDAQTLHGLAQGAILRLGPAAAY